jgi:hypothetical protein
VDINKQKRVAEAPATRPQNHRDELLERVIRKNPANACAP